MPEGNECPACGRNIGIGAVFRAPVPNRIYCPHCRERLRYGDTTLVIAAAVIVLVLTVGAGVALAHTLTADGPYFLLVVLGVLLVGGALIEVVFVCVLWYGSFRLESVNRPKSDWDEDDF